MNTNTLNRIFDEYKKWRNDWDSLCNRCGKCCYIRAVSKSGEVVVDYSSPCEFLDTATQQCRVFENRFTKCAHCGKVNMFHALFNPSMPPDCAYVRTFRLWKNN